MNYDAWAPSRSRPPCQAGQACAEASSAVHPGKNRPRTGGSCCTDPREMDSEQRVLGRALDVPTHVVAHSLNLLG